MLKKIDHIGIAVRDLDAAVQKYSALFRKPADHLEEIAAQKVSVAMFRAGESSVELLQGTADDSPISRFVEKNGEGIHHICYAVADLNAALAAAEEAGMSPIPQENDRGAGGYRIAFLHPKTTGGVLIELVEK
ncbi:MAG TPA: methylmalonyl-CoA epimerase [Bacteroidetes bacterium]|nr:methylmalonyl-CoA epimerase [Bacteroidota bacterium]